jgi:hypothetical protein
MRTTTRPVTPHTQPRQFVFRNLSAKHWIDIFRSSDPIRVVSDGDRSTERQKLQGRIRT